MRNSRDSKNQCFQTKSNMMFKDWLCKAEEVKASEMISTILGKEEQVSSRRGWTGILAWNLSYLLAIMANLLISFVYIWKLKLREWTRRQRFIILYHVGCALNHGHTWFGQGRVCQLGEQTQVRAWGNHYEVLHITFTMEIKGLHIHVYKKISREFQQQMNWKFKKKWKRCQIE